MTIGEIIKEPMVIHGMYDSDAQREAKAVELLDIVGSSPTTSAAIPMNFPEARGSASPLPEPSP